METPKTRIYPVKKHWQIISLIIGFWVWLGLLIQYWLRIFPSERRRAILSAFREMLADGPGSHLCITPDGLEYCLWPIVKIKCDWEAAYYIHRGRWLGDALYLRQANITGQPAFSIIIGSPQIHLSSLVGWADKRLEDDLRRYAPHLFAPPKN